MEPRGIVEEGLILVGAFIGGIVVIVIALIIGKWLQGYIGYWFALGVTLLCSWGGVHGFMWGVKKIWYR